jgi:L-rhamnose mutarotase
MKKIFPIFLMVLFISSCSTLKKSEQKQESNAKRISVFEEEKYLKTKVSPWVRDEIYKIRSKFNISIYSDFQEYVDEFIYYCIKYNIPGWKEKFENIDKITVDTLRISKEDGVLWGIVKTNPISGRKVVLINWISTHDVSFEKVTVFHELAHAILGYKHVCDNCGHIMSKYTRHNMEIINDWDNVMEKLFTESPVKKKNRRLVLQ